MCLDPFVVYCSRGCIGKIHHSPFGSRVDNGLVEKEPDSEPLLMPKRTSTLQYAVLNDTCTHHVITAAMSISSNLRWIRSTRRCSVQDPLIDVHRPRPTARSPPLDLDPSRGVSLIPFAIPRNWFDLMAKVEEELGNGIRSLVSLLSSACAACCPRAPPLTTTTTHVRGGSGSGLSYDHSRLCDASAGAIIITTELPRLASPPSGVFLAFFS